MHLAHLNFFQCFKTRQTQSKCKNQSRWCQKIPNLLLVSYLTLEDLFNIIKPKFHKYTMDITQIPSWEQGLGNQTKL